MHIEIADPRRYINISHSPLREASDEAAAASTQDQRRLVSALSKRVATMLENGEEDSVREALSKPTSASACRALLKALELALSPNGRVGDVAIRVFAIPLLLVVAAQSRTRVGGIIPDVGEICSLFESAGVLGQCRNFSLSSSLAELDTVESIPWTSLYTISRSTQWASFAALELPPADIDIRAGEQTVDLRFLVGAALTPAQAPDFVESGGDIGRWGMSLTELLSRQLGTEQASLLAIPRQPLAVVRALREGWHVAREMGFQLFLSNALRQVRTRTGEPDVMIAPYSDQSIRVRLTSPFDDMFDQTYVWPLVASDRIDVIAHSISGLLDQAGARRVEVTPTIKIDDTEKPASH